MQNQKGIAAPLIIIVIAAFALGLLGPVVYPKIKLQVGQITTSKESNLIEEESTQSADQIQTLSPSNEPQSSPSAPEDAPRAESDAAVEENALAQEDEEQKAQETGTKDEEEESQGEEGIEDEPPANLEFHVLDFSKLVNLIHFLPTPTPTPFISNYIGKIKVFTNLLGSSSPTPTPEPTPTPGPKKAIVVTLDKVKIHDDKDPALNGEAQIISSVRTAFTEQVNAWPYKNWDEANNGDTLKIYQPIFVLPEDAIDEKLAIWVSVIDNDSLPSSATGLIRKAYDISSGSQLLLDDFSRWVNNEIYNQTVGRFLGWLEGSEHIGTLATVVNKSQNFGIEEGNSKTFTSRKGDATFTYTVHKVNIPEKPLRVDFKINKVKVGESGDTWPNDGDLYIWSYISDGYEDKNPHGLAKRIPGSGEHTKEDDSTWNVDKEIFSGKITGPIFYYQIGVWDDDANYSNDDQLEIVSDTLYMSDYKAGDVVKTSKDGDDGVDASATIEREIKFFATD